MDINNGLQDTVMVDVEGLAMDLARLEMDRRRTKVQGGVEDGG